MNKRKGITAILLLSMLILLLAGCGKKFDASGYTKAILDVSYKNETEEYMKLTNSSKEDAEAIFTDNLGTLMAEFDGLNLSEDLQSKYKDFFEDISKSVKYTVGEAVEDKQGNFTVDVTVEPITNFSDTYDEFLSQAEAYSTQIGNDVMNGAVMPSEEDMQNQVFEIFYNILRESLDAGVNYGEPQTITMHVNKDANNVYEIPEADLTALDNLTLSTDVL